MLRFSLGKWMWGGLVVASILVGPRIAVAQDVGGIDTNYSIERFRLSSDRNGILSVESADVLGHLVFEVGLWLGYADDPLNVYRTDVIERRRVGSLVSHRVGGNLVGAFSLIDRVQVGLDIPLILSQDQSVNDLMGPPDSLPSFGLGDIRLAPKIQLLKNEDQGLDVSILVGFTVPTGTKDEYFGEEGATFAPEILVSKKFNDRVRAGGNLGFRSRKRQQALDLEVDDEVNGRLGVAYMMTPRLELDATVSVTTASNDIFGAFNRNSSELLGGAAYHLNRLIVFGALGGGTSEGFGTPDWRLLVGVRMGLGNARSESEVETGKEVFVVDTTAQPVRDSDNDGIADEVDACPTVAETINGIDDADGCPEEAEAGDRDNDGVLDSNDSCPDESEDLDNFEDMDGCPEPDNDKDGVLDAADLCVRMAGPHENGGCPDLDRDGDTVVDRLDNCPDVAGAPVNIGCKEEQLVKLSGSTLEILDRVYFATNKALIRPRSYRLLRNVAAVLNNHPEIGQIEVEGHTDNRGDDAYNKTLSQKRAESVVQFLKDQGVAGERLTAKGFGEEKPIGTNDTKEGQAANRRVDFKLVGTPTATIENANSSPTQQ